MECQPREGYIRSTSSLHVTHAAVQVLGDNLLALIKAMDYRGIPIPIVKRITRQVGDVMPCTQARSLLQ